MQKLLSLLAFLVVVFLAGCESEQAENAEALGVDAWLPLGIGGKSIEVQVALTRSERRKGLMYRDSLPENSGMLFPSEEPGRLSFWMLNTYIPLDIGFFDSEGLLLEVHRMYPHDTNRTYSHGDDLQFALEMNSGWFSANGIYPGERLDMELVKEALRKRGRDPGLYGLD